MDVARLIPLPTPPIPPHTHTPTQSQPPLEETQHSINGGKKRPGVWCPNDTCINSSEVLLLLLGTLVLLAEQHWWGAGGEVRDPDQATITYWSLTVWPPSWKAEKQWTK